MLTFPTSNLSYGASQALWGVSLGAEPGKVTCLMGRNGVGKTSTLRAIAGQQAVQSGTMELEGKPIGTMKPHDRARAGIAFVPQGRERSFRCLPFGKTWKPATPVCHGRNGRCQRNCSTCSRC